MRISDWSSDVCSSDLEVPDLGGELVHQVDVGIEAQVARSLDHEVALGLAVLLLQLVEPVPQRSVGGVAGPGPQAQVAVRVGPVAAARSEARRGGNEWVSTCRSRGSPDHYKKKPQ